MEKIVQTVFFNNDKPPYIQDWSVCKDHYKPFLQAWIDIISYVIKSDIKFKVSTTGKLIPTSLNDSAFSQGKLFNI